MRGLTRALPVIVAIVTTWCLTTASAQSTIPNGVFVRNSEGLVWLVLDGQRVKIPVWTASDDDIAALPVSDRWAMMNDDGSIVAGDRPAWLADAPPALLNPAVAAAPPTATPASVPAPTTAPAASGNSLTYQGLTVTVLKIERGWKSSNQFIKPHDGNEFITFDVRADNATSDQIQLNPASFKVATEDGARWDRSSARDPSLPSGAVIPGTPMRGWVTFEVPVGRRVIQFLWEARYNQTLVLPVQG